MKSINELDVSSLTFSALRRNPKGGKMIYINYGSSRTEVELPSMRAPFGLSAYTDQASGNVSYTMNLSVDDSEVLAKLRDIETAVLAHVTKNSAEILGKVYTADVIKTVLFKSFIQESKDGKYAPTLKVKVMYDSRNQTFGPEAYDSDRNLTSIDKLQKGQTVRTIIDFNQIWCVDNKFGVSVRLLQALMMSPSNFSGFAFKDTDPEIENVEDM